MFLHFFLAAQERGPGGKDGKKETHGRRRFVSYEDQWSQLPENGSSQEPGHKQPETQGRGEGRGRESHRHLLGF